MLIFSDVRYQEPIKSINVWRFYASSAAYDMLGSVGVCRTRMQQLGRPRASAAIVIGAMLSPVVQVGAFCAIGGVGRISRTLRGSRVAIQSCVVERDVQVSISIQEKSRMTSGAERIRDESTSRSFFENIGSPRYIAAPMVEHSEAVSMQLPIRV